MRSGGPQDHGNSLENHFISAKAGIHFEPEQRWAPAFAKATTIVVFIPLCGRPKFTQDDMVCVCQSAHSKLWTMMLTSELGIVVLSNEAV